MQPDMKASILNITLLLYIHKINVKAYVWSMHEAAMYIHTYIRSFLMHTCMHVLDGEVSPAGYL